ncbi:hypothetical protein P3S67_001826 [Capsicum chacoense]
MAYTVDEFSKHFIELKNNIPGAAHVLENVLSFEKWSRVHCPGNRYDMMTTNITESLNSVLMDEREYPMSYILNLITRKFGKKFRERHAFFAGQNNKFVSCAERILRDNKSVSDSLYMTNENGGLDQFTMFSNSVAVKASLLERSCSYRKFNLVKMLCEHAMAALRVKYGDGIGYGNSIYEYSSPIYKAKNYLLAYWKLLNLSFQRLNGPCHRKCKTVRFLHPSYDRKLGRKKFKHTKGISETFKDKKRNRCLICKKSEHKRTTCGMANKS